MRRHATKRPTQLSVLVRGCPCTVVVHCRLIVPQFEKILALSMGSSWRTRGLKDAADLVGLEVTIPVQGGNSQELVDAFRSMGQDAGRKMPASGSAAAWLAHLDLLRHVIASGFETAFIVEDDVDFDVRLRDQMQLVSDNIRNFTSAPDDDDSPYGLDWDVLWLGHCGSALYSAISPDVLKYQDDSRCTTEHYSGWSKHFLRDNLEEGFRAIQTSMQTVCTFGYGVNRKSAPKVLKFLASGQDEAFDVALSSHCNGEELKCIVVNPQIMNHYEPPEGYEYESQVHIGDGKGPGADETTFEKKKGTTGNIERSARCEALFGETCMRPPSEI
jgi:hypothetical protein